MTMAASGVAKLIEECGELQQILGKKLAYWYTDDHPDGRPITKRIENEMGDVLAAISFVCTQLGLDLDRIDERTESKLILFSTWEADLANNDYAIDGDTERSR